MKYPDFPKQHHCDAATLAFADFVAQYNEQRVDIAPLDVTACRAGKDRFESALMPPLHANMVPQSGTTSR